MSTNQAALAVLCADITGGALLQAHLGGPEADRAIRRCEKRISQTLEGFEGRLVRGSGNRLMAYFTDTGNALQSAIDVQKRIAALPPLSGISLGVRVGVCVGHTGKENRFFDDESANPAVSLSEQAQPGQLLLSIPDRSEGIPWSQPIARPMPQLSLRCGKRQLDVFELDWRHCDTSVLNLGESLAPPPPRLALSDGERDVLLDAHRDHLTIGRQPDCDIVLRDIQASRIHARIERRGETYVLIDQSTNGTWITVEGKKEKVIRRGELLLTGRGRLSFCGPAVDCGRCCVHYRVET